MYAEYLRSLAAARPVSAHADLNPLLDLLVAAMVLLQMHKHYARYLQTYFEDKNGAIEHFMWVSLISHC
jgi:hypothetical protein